MTGCLLHRKHKQIINRIAMERSAPDDEDATSDLTFVGLAPPSVEAGRAPRTCYEGPLACCLLPVAILAPPAWLPATLDMPPTRTRITKKRAEMRRIALDLDRRGFSVCDSGLETLAHQAAAEASALDMQQGGFVKAGRPASGESRGDRTCMLRAAGHPPHALMRLDSLLEDFGRGLLDELEHLALDPEAGLGPLGCGPRGELLRYAGRSDMQIACYPGDAARYYPHIDNGDGDGRTSDLGRVLSIVLYTSDLEAADGGALRLHVLPEVAQGEPALAEAVGDEHVADFSAVVDVLPRAGLLVAFRADRIPHEVRPCYRERTALTVWILAKGWGV